MIFYVVCRVGRVKSTSESLQTKSHKIICKKEERHEKLWFLILKCKWVCYYFGNQNFVMFQKVIGNNKAKSPIQSDLSEV